MTVIYAKHYSSFKYFVIFIGIIGLFVSSCSKPPEYPIEPVIGFVEITKSTVQQNTDTFSLVISFTDGDGDLGWPEDAINSGDIFVVDSRTGNVLPYKIPEIEPQGVSNGISGEIKLLLIAECCIDVLQPCINDPENQPETYSYLVQIKDRADNFSNQVETTPITLLCAP